MTRLNLEVQRVSSAPDIPEDCAFERWAKAALDGRLDKAELVIRLVDEEESRALNLSYRKKDKPTNVLSFPFAAPEFVESDLIGDLVICAPLVAKEANEQRKPLHHHYAHLVVHGVLHLMGYDHEDDQEAEEMEQEERVVLAELNIPDPYLDDMTDE